MGNIAQIQGVKELTAEFETLQNGRWRLTRVVELQGAANVDDGTFKSLGALLSAEYATKGDETKFQNLVLVKQGSAPAPKDPKGAIWTGVYETLTGSFVAEVDDRTETVENGLARLTKVLIATAGTSHASYVVGTSTSGDLKLAQKLVEENDAYVRVTLVYGAAGVLTRTTTTSNNGALSTIVIESADEVPATPADYVEISRNVVGEEGFETTRYTFAKGLGQVSREDGESNNGALLTATIRYLSAPGTLGTKGANPITTPSGYVLVSDSYQEADGHRIWTANYAKGDGEISREDQSSNNGALLTANIRYLTAPDGTDPITTLSGYVRVSNSMQEADGHRIWTASFAQGSGQISYEPGSSNNGKLLTVAIRHLTSPSGTNPISTPSGYTLVGGPSYQEADGHRVWSASFAKGDGQISYEPQSSNNGKLLTLVIRHLTAPAASNPISTPSGYVLVGGPSYQEADGHLVWSASFAKGDGEISRRVVAEGNGARLVSVVTLYPPTPALTSAPAAIVWDVQQRDGHQVESTTVLEALDGTSLVGTAGVAKLAYFYEDLVDFEKPGTIDVEAYTTDAPGPGLPDGEGIKLVQTPPISIKVKAKIFVFYQSVTPEITSGDYTYDSATGLWNPTSWPVIDATYIPSGGAQVIVSDAYRGYRMADLTESPKTVTAELVESGLSWTNPVVFGTICAGTSGFAPVHTVVLSGGPANPDGVKYVLDVNFGNGPAFQLADGTSIWRKTIAVATITAAA